MKKKKLILIILIIFSNLIFYSGIFYSLGEIDSWNRTWGTEDADWCMGIDIDLEDNIYIIGRNQVFSENSEEEYLFLLKYDNLGNLIWEKQLDIYIFRAYYFIDTDSLSNVYIASNTDDYYGVNSDICLMKFDSSGNLLWNQTWSRGNDHCSAIGIDSSDNIYIAGNTIGGSLGGENMLLLKYNSSGALLLNHTWGGPTDDLCYGLTIDSFDNLYITGRIENKFLEDTLILLKCNTTGKVLWNRTWNDYYYTGSIFTVDASNNIIIAGWNYILKYDHLGNLIWNTTRSEKIKAREDITADSQDNIYITGYHLYTCSTGLFTATTCSCMTLNIYNSSGYLKNEFQCYKADSSGVAIAIDSTGNLYIAGEKSTGNFNTQNIVLIKNPTEYVEDDDLFYIYYFTFVPIVILCIGLIILYYFRKKKR